MSNALSNAGWLKVLATKRMTLDQTEWCTLACVLIANRPCTAVQIAARLGLETGACTPIVDELVRWQFLTYTAEGFAFQPDPEQWGPPTQPGGGASPAVAQLTKTP